MNQEKFDLLSTILKSYKKVIVAFSGGVDSTLLLKLCCEILGPHHVLAVTGVSQTYTREEKDLAQQLSKEFGNEHIILETGELSREEFSKNPANRCYFCKQELYTKIRAIAKEKGFDIIIDATNADDVHDYRPGRKAAQDLGIISPLVEAKVTKNDIRELSKERNLITWNKPANPCLASRVPYGTEITETILHQIGEGEKFIRSLGYRIVRLRHHNECARIEIPSEDFERFISSSHRKEIVLFLKSLGYRYVTLDIEGFRTGSMNEVLERNPQ
jgi:uncharacterized protein